jgi:hypothetical protein
MGEVKDTDLSIGMLRPHSSKRLKRSIKFDEHLDALLGAEGIEDPGEQMLICEALCALGLAKHFRKHTNTLKFQEHYYTSSKTMRKLAKEWL